MQNHNPPPLLSRQPFQPLAQVNLLRRKQLFAESPHPRKVAASQKMNEPASKRAVRMRAFHSSTIKLTTG